MPAYSFQERFVPMVLDGSKTQTIRKRRKYSIKKGDAVSLYFGMRTKYCRKLRQEICTEATTVVFDTTEKGEFFITLFDRRLDDNEFEIKDGIFDTDIEAVGFKLIKGKNRDRFAWLDGFRPEESTLENPAGSYDLMSRWWKQTHQLPFVGDLIKWSINP